MLEVTSSAIIAKAKTYVGQFTDGPDVPKLAEAVGLAFPEMAAYCHLAKDDTPWCGIFAAYVLAQFGIKSPYTPGDDLQSFMWVDSWLDFGTTVPVGHEQPGDIAIFITSGLHHVTFVDGGGYYVGGNQGNAVTREHFSAVPTAIRRIVATAIASPPTAPTSSDGFERCIPLLLESEGGNDDDPRDPGGRTSRGILQSEWDKWRLTHPGLPSDVWQAPQDQILAIYREKYWDVLQCDKLPPGVDYAVFDYGVLQGVGRAATVLQSFVGADVDGEIGPLTIAATNEANPATLINDICDERLSFLKGLKTWPTFGKGWTNRVERVRVDSLRMVLTVQPKPAPTPEPLPPADPWVQEVLDKISVAIRPIVEDMKGMAPVPAVQNNIQIPDWLLKIAKEQLDKAPPAKPPTQEELSKLDSMFGKSMVGYKTLIGIAGTLATWVWGPSTGLSEEIQQSIMAVFIFIAAFGTKATVDRGIDAIRSLAKTYADIKNLPPQQP